MLCEGDLSLFLNELFGLHSRVEIELDFLQALLHALFVVNSLQAKLLLEVCVISQVVSLTLLDLIVTIF